MIATPMIKQQTEIKYIATFFNRSLIAQTWLSVAASEYAYMFRDDETAIVGWTQCAVAKHLILHRS